VTHDVELVRAPNPGPFTLDGTNTWLVGRDPAWVVDPGPDDAGHVAAVLAAARRRGGIGGLALTHDHADHAEAVPALRATAGGTVPVAAARGEVDLVLGDGDVAGPLTALATPGHAPDHLAYVAGPLACTGDAVLGAGSVFVQADLAAYLAALRRLRELDLERLLPGHGPIVTEPRTVLDAYVAHRLERERGLLAALAAGHRTVDALLDAAWSDAPAALRPAAALTLGAHLDKLAAEGRLPAGVERPPRLDATA
jgi:glyoxylase-like metal-dependent hydrolase (beta-lactamase superfamily II)